MIWKSKYSKQFPL